jgi:acyl carrier protein
MREGTVRDRCLAILEEYYGEDEVVMNGAKNNSGEIFAPHGSSLWTAGKLDSIDRTEYVMALEDEFNIDIDDKAASEFRTFDHVVKHVESKSGPAFGAH